ncbi:hypothetical protein TIFTF001_035777 [Ficus carica]|uniref:Uncharacterized protein n=1 Tax=Ficus carica TaxID=3494 RepID=A0AA88E409_FICCA|nr:hypothetical protein TIFTF001_035777 [Ficus carica]
MSDLSSDSENDNLSGEVDITGSSSTDSLDSTDRTEDEVGPVTQSYRSFLEELNGALAPVQHPLVNLTTDESAYARSIRQASTSGREETFDEGSESPRARLLQYLESLREEFWIPGDVKIVVPGPNDLPSRPPPGYVTLSMEFFQAKLRLPFHPFLRRALRRLNVAPMQLNANAYRILISYFVFWTKYYCTKLSFRAFSEFVPDENNPVVVEVLLIPRWLSGRLDYAQVPRGVPVVSTSGLLSGSSSPGTWGSRIVDEGVEGNRAWPTEGNVNDRMTRTGLLGCSRSAPKATMEAEAIQVARALLQLVESFLTLM